jgi:hypothetical protein
MWATQMALPCGTRGQAVPGVLEVPFTRHWSAAVRLVLLPSTCLRWLERPKLHWALFQSAVVCAGTSKYEFIFPGTWVLYQQSDLHVCSVAYPVNLCSWYYLETILFVYLFICLLVEYFTALSETRFIRRIVCCLLSSNPPGTCERMMYYPGICLEPLRWTTMNLRTASAATDVRHSLLPNTSLDRCRCANLLYLRTGMDGEAVRQMFCWIRTAFIESEAFCLCVVGACREGRMRPAGGKVCCKRISRCL